MSAQADKKRRAKLLKKLRELHAETVGHTQEALRAQKHIQKEISQAISGQPSTVPEVAEATGLPSHEVLWWLASLRKYGVVAEDGMRADYPVYRLVEEAP